MTPTQRWGERVALAMLPAGAVMTLVSVIGFVVVALLAFDTIVRRPAAAGLLLAWCLAAATVAVRNTLLSIETMSSFEWRPLAKVAAFSAIITAAFPGWWTGG